MKILLIWVLTVAGVSAIGQAPSSVASDHIVAEDSRPGFPSPDGTGAAADYARGLAYLTGDGVSQSFELAAVWLRKAAQQNLADAQNFLAVMYDNGTGVPADERQAFAWYRRAAEQGHAAAQNNLGLMYEIGRGVSLDYAAALRWYQLAANQGWAPAQANLGLVYVGGVGVPADPIEGAMWLRIAVQQASGDEQVRYESLREAVEKKMSAEDLVEAWQRARAWLIAFQRR